VGCCRCEALLGDVNVQWLLCCVEACGCCSVAVAVAVVLLLLLL